jgi:AAA15 family ATPase/GTPase
VEPAMLIQFSVENFRVFKNKVTLSMAANKSYKEHIDNQHHHDNFSDIPLLNSAIIYGANGAGKSSFIKALAFYKNLINQGFIDKDNDLNWQPFLFDKVSPNRPTQFEISFIGHDGIRYHYGLSLNNDRVLDEYLLSYSKKGARAKTIYSRVYDQRKNAYDHYHPALNESKKTVDVIIDKLTKSPKTTFLRALCQYNAPQIKPVMEWMTSSIFVVPFNQTESFVSLTKSNLVMLMLDPKRGNEYKRTVIELLNNFDLSISDIKVVKRDIPLPDHLSKAVEAQMFDDIGYEIVMYHRVSSGESYPILYDDLSSGSQKLLNICSFLYLCRSSKKSTVLIFDEIESSFHPSVIKRLYQILMDDPDLNVQLIITTHSPILLDPALIRRDQVWFIEKNDDLHSELYNLPQFSPSISDNFVKNWMTGRYGGVPDIDWE